MIKCILSRIFVLVLVLIKIKPTKSTVFKKKFDFNLFKMFPYYVYLRTNSSCREPMSRVVDRTGIHYDVTGTDT